MGRLTVGHMRRYTLHQVAVRISKHGLQALKLLLIVPNRPFDTLDPLIHGIELIAGHDVARNLPVSAFGAFGQLRYCLLDIVNRMSHDL